MIDGGAGIDILDYSKSPSGVEVDFAAGTGAGGDAEGDRIANMESMWGSAFADRITGSDRVDSLSGKGGADELEGGAGDDWLRGKTTTIVCGARRVTTGCWAEQERIC